jgi:hypothetical protein
MREHGNDPNFIAKSLLNQPKMIKALEAYDSIDNETADYSDFGLD